MREDVRLSECGGGDQAVGLIINWHFSASKLLLLSAQLVKSRSGFIADGRQCFVIPRPCFHVGAACVLSLTSHLREEQACQLAVTYAGNVYQMCRPNKSKQFSADFQGGKRATSYMTLIKTHQTHNISRPDLLINDPSYSCVAKQKSQHDLQHGGCVFPGQIRRRVWILETTVWRTVKTHSSP